MWREHWRKTMSQSTGSLSAQQILIESYFDAWRQHDLVALGQLFNQNATYEIEGKTALTGIEQISAYWRRNRARQSQLQVNHGILEIDVDSGRAHFLSSFYD